MDCNGKAKQSAAFGDITPWLYCLYRIYTNQSLWQLRRSGCIFTASCHKEKQNSAPKSPRKYAISTLKWQKRIATGALPSFQSPYPEGVTSPRVLRTYGALIRLLDLVPPFKNATLRSAYAVAVSRRAEGLEFCSSPPTQFHSYPWFFAKLIQISDLFLFLNFKKVGKFAASVERSKTKSASASGGTPWPGALPLDPARGSASKPPL